MLETINTYSGSIALALLVVFSILRFIAPKTNTDIDNKIVAGLDTGLAWLKTNMPDAYVKIEKAATTGSLTGGAAKLAAYLWELNVNYIADHGVPMPVELIESATRKAEAMADKDTVAKASGDAAVKAILRAAGNPQPAPVSK